MVPHPGDFDYEWQKLRKHPDFSFGVVFAKQDWPRQVPPPGLDQDEIEARLADTGYDIIDAYGKDNACDTDNPSSNTS